jgi:hypothetical protein
MSIKTINVGAVQNDGTGDQLRDAFVKVNENFAELEGSVGSVSAANAAALRDRATHTGQQAIGTVAGLQSALDAKVDKVAGKGLSTEDYTTSEKNKLAGVAAGAQVNTVTSVAGKTGAVTLAKGDVGLGNVDNTADSVKPVSTAQATAIAARYGKNNVLGTVSQSAGVPTGAVIERGSNANGEYVRFADGTQICTISSAFTEAAEVVWSYPAIFAADPNYLSASVNYRFSPRYYNVDAAITGGNISATIYRSVRETRAPVADGFGVNVMAVGRWF